MAVSLQVHTGKLYLLQTIKQEMKILKGGEKKHSHSCKFIKPSKVEKQKTKNMIYFCLLLLLKGLVVKYTSYVLLNQKKIRYKIYAHFSNPIHLLNLH